MKLLSILIPTTPDRKPLLAKLVSELQGQRSRLLGRLPRQVEILLNETPSYKSQPTRENFIGFKRNELLVDAQGEYVAFVDSDDRVSPGYLPNLVAGMIKGADCCSLTGIITEDGKNPKTFIHSVKYKEYREHNGIYERYPNHLNCIRAAIAKQFRFPEINHGEDTDFATQIFRSGLIKTEHWIEEPIYFYDYISKK